MDDPLKISMNGYMNKPRHNRIAAVRKRRGCTQQQLADILGVHWVTISKLERGKMQLTEYWIDRIASALGVNFHEILEEKISGYEISVTGDLLNGGRVEDSTWDKLYRIENHQTHDHAVNWIQVRGEAGWPIFQDGDLIKFVVLDPARAIEYLGRIVHTKFGPNETDRIIGYLDRGSRDETFDIRPINAGPKRDIKLEDFWVAMECHFLLASAVQAQN